MSQNQTINTFVLEYLLDLIHNQQTIPSKDISQKFIQLISKNYDQGDFVLRLRLLNEKFRELQSLSLEDEDDDEMIEKCLNSLKKLLNEINPTQFRNIFPNANFGKEDYLSKLKKWELRLTKTSADIDSKKESLEKIIRYAAVLCNSLGSPRIVDVFSSFQSNANSESSLQKSFSDDRTNGHNGDAHSETFEDDSQITTPSKKQKQQLTPFSSHVKNTIVDEMDETGDGHSSTFEPSTLNFDYGTGEYDGFVEIENSENTDIVVVMDDEELRMENLRKRKTFEGACSFAGLKQALKNNANKYNRLDTSFTFSDSNCIHFVTNRVVEDTPEIIPTPSSPLPRRTRKQKPIPYEKWQPNEYGQPGRYWTQRELDALERGLNLYGKDFKRILQEFKSEFHPVRTPVSLLRKCERAFPDKYSNTRKNNDSGNEHEGNDSEEPFDSVSDTE
ncbi:hypothetical protein C9374_006804 [Naegleria lovaniensis]|uniref:Myb-like domain-containing protein n=1 Tax=Naegleria lovaniensis TaxID=51637 RepID=A0AA88GYA2_NAELO|nr:uncharacterized protein C9374_006804 [Naegleria lovaniensis]KAG2393273.1 hypothetical protein C9374_006804 [Naegleria lovaniensis]